MLNHVFCCGEIGHSCYLLYRKQFKCCTFLFRKLVYTIRICILLPIPRLSQIFTHVAPHMNPSQPPPSPPSSFSARSWRNFTFPSFTVICLSLALRVASYCWLYRVVLWSAASCIATTNQELPTTHAFGEWIKGMGLLPELKSGVLFWIKTLRQAPQCRSWRHGRPSESKCHGRAASVGG